MILLSSACIGLSVLAFIQSYKLFLLERRLDQLEPLIVQAKFLVDRIAARLAPDDQ